LHSLLWLKYQTCCRKAQVNCDGCASGLCILYCASLSAGCDLPLSSSYPLLLRVMWHVVACAWLGLRFITYTSTRCNLPLSISFLSLHLQRPFSRECLCCADRSIMAGMVHLPSPLCLPRHSHSRECYGPCHTGNSLCKEQ
jgi:hypothetical protein